MSQRSVVICGNGASAALLVRALVQSADGVGISITVIGTGKQFGAGLAYSTSNPNHLLNVPAARLSADPRIPDNFSIGCTDRTCPPGHSPSSLFRVRCIGDTGAADKYGSGIFSIRA